MGSGMIIENICKAHNTSINLLLYLQFTNFLFQNNDVLNITHFHYVGWSGMLGEVPLVTHGIMEIITRVQSHRDTSLSITSPILVHCT